jgi:uncharacterized surface protein with fasciclin (FAS1) repeats
MSFVARLTPFLSALALVTVTSLVGCASNSMQASMPANVVVAAGQRADLTTFTKLLQQSGLASTLEGTGPFTVFAPTDAAFKAVPAATLDKLAKDPQALKNVLSYHVMPGVFKSTDISGAVSLPTLNTAKLAVAKAGDFVTADDALVVQADVATSNGVVHVVDSVLMPAVKK